MGHLELFIRLLHRLFELVCGLCKRLCHLFLLLEMSFLHLERLLTELLSLFALNAALFPQPENLFFALRKLILGDLGLGNNSLEVGVLAVDLLLPLQLRGRREQGRVEAGLRLGLG